MVKTVSLKGSGSDFIFEFDPHEFFCTCFLKCNGQKYRLGMKRLDELAERFLKALTRSEQEIKEAYLDDSKNDNTTLVAMFGSASLATIEYEHNGVTIQWKDARRKVLGVTKLDEKNKRKWIQELQKLQQLVNAKG